MPPGIQHEVFDFGLHINPESLRGALQQVIDAVISQARGGGADLLDVNAGTPKKRLLMGLQAQACGTKAVDFSS